MADRSPARWLAPLALVAAGLTLVVVIGTSMSSSDSPPPEPSVTTPSATTTARKKPAPRKAAAGPSKGATGATGATGEASYTVQPGDYLSTVAEKTGVPVNRLRELNPGLDATSMTVGQKIRLKP